MRKINLGIITLLLFFMGCNVANSPAKRLVTIKYCSEPMRTFEIVRTNIKGVKLEQLTDVLKKYKSENPNTEYELYAEVKCVPEEEQAIKKAIRDAEIKLKHYWAPVSIKTDKSKESPYGPGFIDIGN
jgi:hypothetical protein